MERSLAGGAQTSRPNDAGPVGTLLGGMASPAAYLPGAVPVFVTMGP
jgi:hypothetical protein